MQRGVHRYLNPDPWARLVGDRNETVIKINQRVCKALIDSGAQLSQITKGHAKRLGLKIKSLERRFGLEGAGGAPIPYHGYVEVMIDLPQVKAFDEPCLLLVVNDSSFGKKCPVILGTLHIDLILSKATKEELETLNRAWQRGNVGTMIQTQLATISGELDKINGSVKLLQEITVKPGETVKVNGQSSHPVNCKRVNVMLEPCEGVEGSYTVNSYTFTKSNSRRVPVMLRNLSARPVTLQKGARVAKLSPANKVPKMLAPKTDEDGELVAKSASILSKAELEKRLEKLRSKVYLSGCDSWPEELRCKARALIEEYQDIFALDDNELGKTSLVKHKIKLTDPEPIKQRARRIPPHQYTEVRKHLKEMMDIGAIKRSNSPWASPVVLVRKKTGELRFCIDLRKLNNRTVKDAYALPRIENSLDSLNGAMWFTSLDLKSGYWQVEMDEESQPYTAFTVGPLGFYECCRMPFGLCNAPATFQRLMESCLGDLHLQQCIIYLDDIIIFSKTPEEHLGRLRNVFQKLREAGLKLKPSKCEFFKQEIKYLGHVVSKDGIATDNSKIQAIIEWPRPTTVTEVRSFLGFTNYYRKFIHRYAQVAKPLNKLIAGENAKCKRKKVEWSPECEIAMEKLKELCTSTPILAYADYTKPFRLNTDASSEGLGAVLYQTQDDGTERVISYASRSLSKSERNYDAHKLEFLALKWAITDRFHEYLYGGKCEVYTDNNPLIYVPTTAKLDATGQRWVAALARYDFHMNYRSGKSNNDADALSRIEWQMKDITDLIMPVVESLVIGEIAENVLPPIMPIVIQNLMIDPDYRLSRRDWQFEQGADESVGVIMKYLVEGKSSCPGGEAAEVRALWKLRKQLLF